MNYHRFESKYPLKASEIIDTSVMSLKALKSFVAKTVEAKTDVYCFRTLESDYDENIGSIILVPLLKFSKMFSKNTPLFLKN
jgi:hypothetical protein